MLWIPVTLLIVVAVSILLDLVDYHSEGNRIASLVIRCSTLFVCFLSLVEVYFN
jgi:hypothetical protein